MAMGEDFDEEALAARENQLAEDQALAEAMSENRKLDRMPGYSDDNAAFVANSTGAEEYFNAGGVDDDGEVMVADEDDDVYVSDEEDQLAAVEHETRMVESYDTIENFDGDDEDEAEAQAQAEGEAAQAQAMGQAAANAQRRRALAAQSQKPENPVIDWVVGSKKKITLQVLERNWNPCKKSKNALPWFRGTNSLAVAAIATDSGNGPNIGIELFSRAPMLVGGEYDLIGTLLSMKNSIPKRGLVTGVTALIGFFCPSKMADCKDTAMVELLLNQILNDKNFQTTCQRMFDIAAKELNK